MLKLIQCEYIKLKRSKLLFIGLLGTLPVPFFVIVRAVINCFYQPEAAISLFSLYDDAFMFLMLLFGPMVLTVLGTWIISREYTDGTLKNIFAIPVSRPLFLTGKLLFFAILALTFMMISWLEILAFTLLCSCFFQVTGLTPLSALFFLGRMLLGGVLLCVTQMPFIYLAIRAKGMAAPLIAMSAVSLVNVVLSNSPVAGFYPWSASYLLALGRLSGQGYQKKVSVCIIGMTGLFGIVASMRRFQKEML